jgi:nicotinate-nucleotide adenylyltransferase
MPRIGIFSGTFDPVHAGHIAFCQAALEQGGLTKVILLPEAEPRDKQGVTPLKHRVAMLRLAIQDESGFEVLELPQRQFSVADTLPELSQRFPKDELVLLVGSDVVQTFSFRWPGLEQLLEQMELIIGLRRHDTPADIDALVQQLTLKVRYQCIPSPQAHAASARVRLGQHGVLDLDPKVANYIAKQQLYAAY